MNNKQIKIKSDSGSGTLRFSSKSKPFCQDEKIEYKGGNVYEMNIEKEKEIEIQYEAVK